MLGSIVRLRFLYLNITKEGEGRRGGRKRERARVNEGGWASGRV